MLYQDALSIGPLHAPPSSAVTMIIGDDGGIIQVEAIPASLPRHDLILLSQSYHTPGARDPKGPETISPLPVSPYPAQVGTEIAAHFIIDKESLKDPNEEGWVPCFNGMMYRKWAKGHVVGYRNFAGNEAKARKIVCIHFLC